MNCCEFRLWISRIGIGRWSDVETWERAVERRARRWLRRLPVVSATDSGRKRRSATIQSWQMAGLLLGLDSEEAHKVAARLFDPATGDWRIPPAHPDSALLAWALAKHGALSENARRTTLDTLLKLRGDNPTLPYRAHIPHLRFVDTIGLTLPFLTHCGRDDIARAQLAEYDAALLPGTQLPAHAWDPVQGVPLGIYDWSRGAGWYALGLVEMEESGRGKLPAHRLVALARDMLRFQRPDGGWGAMFFNPRSTFEASGTALAGLLMMAARKTDPDPRFLAAAIAARKSLMSATRRNGAIDFCQGDTLGPGLYSRTFDIMPFAQGIALRLSKQLGHANGEH
jgi:unsaturated rhamnogalacturonyl hydrolase